MVTKGFFIRIEARPDRVQDVENLLKSAVDHIRDEGLAAGWFALRLGPRSFAVLDAFADEHGRDAHWEANGATLAGLPAADLFAEPALVERVDIVASVLPAD